MPRKTQHEITYVYYPPKYGDRPEPWQRCYSCTCGADLGFDEEGAGAADVKAAFEEHIAEEGLDPNDYV